MRPEPTGTTSVPRQERQLSTYNTGVPYGDETVNPATSTKRAALQRLTPRDATWTWRDAVVAWMQEHADVLWVEYLIWQGRIWSVARDSEGWRDYNGGGMHDPTDVTGGHYDHLHALAAS